MTTPSNTAAHLMDDSNFEALTDATSERIYRSLLKSVGKKQTKYDNRLATCRRAITQTLDAWLAGQTEAERAAFFASLEAVATKSNARHIALHPLRPADVVAKTAPALPKADHQTPDA